MALAWNEIKDRALSFSKEWAKSESEDAEAKPFCVDFFNVFGITSNASAALNSASTIKRDQRELTRL
jgi:hypothetical protein